ncbi:DNA alkylation repair protein [Dongshaea marina]|uniref:DNA alkylation repair protein n=1 Tax=Dongshaea marina TaxID=2047966 RepID=UPI000D3EC4B6|nr:DNA alkylation repair protein [Dongshaea marina]
MGRVERVHQRLQELADPQIASHALGFFKTGPGEYGEGDRFLGIRVPVLRREVKQYRELTLEDLCLLLESSFHECRLLALLVMVDQYQRGSEEQRLSLYQLYLENTRGINSWDLVDSSAPHILGAQLFNLDRQPLYQLAQSDSLWERRMAIIATFYFIRRDDFTDTLRIAKLMLEDKQDLIHKATGWMLREIGKRDLDCLLAFLGDHHQQMPRVMLRYAIERLDKALRQRFLKGK